MLVIRDQQMKAFESVARRNFQREMIRHISQFAPGQFEILGEKVIEGIIDTGIDRAGRYGLTNRGPVRFYIELMFMFGSDFDTDPQYPWVAGILDGHEIDDQMTRAERLYDKAMECVEKISGPGLAYEKEALERAILIPLEYSPILKENFRNELIQLFEWIHQEKCAYIGESALDALMHRAAALAGRHNVYSRMGVALFAGLMFAFGHGCCTDPQFSWIAETLNDTRQKDAEKRIDRLHRKMMTYFKNALTLMERK